MLGRRAGVLVHPTSLPGPYGIGDLGPTTERFLDWCVESGISLWQILPLGPTSQGHSPYSGVSAFAGNPLLISPERLADLGWIERPEPWAARETVDYEGVDRWKQGLLEKAWRRFRAGASADVRRDYEEFVEETRRLGWLDDWALYAALKQRAGQRAWVEWDVELRTRDAGTLARMERELADEIDFQRFLQFLFAEQWGAVLRAARDRDIIVLGDVPFYPGHDSSDVWAHQELYRLDEAGCPAKVAGVPPDYFSEDGQLWGNPVYDWQRLAQADYAWWGARLEANLQWTDALRLDHFRAFAAYWEVDAGQSTAVDGRWVPGPGRGFFESLRRRFGGLPFVAEDLGDITADVLELRDELELPGMRVLQFAFSDPLSDHHPSRHTRNCVAYTGTHDNDTLLGWLEALSPVERERLAVRTEARQQPDAWQLIEMVYESVADSAVVPLQDFLQLGSRARMNRPGVPDGNWRWRALGSALEADLAERLRSLAEGSRRI